MGIAVFLVGSLVCVGFTAYLLLMVYYPEWVGITGKVERDRMRLEQQGNCEIYRVEPATPADLDELAQLINSAYRGESSRRGWTTEADFIDGQRTDAATLSQDIDGSRTILCLRAQTRREILGCVLLEDCPSDRGRYCYLGMLTVRPDLQARGVGRLILIQAEEYARNQGAQSVTLGVIQLRHSLIAWYERRGYRRTGETKPFPYGNVKFGLPQRQDLHFVMFEKPL